MTVQTLTPDSLLQATRILAKLDGDFARILNTYGPPPLWDRKPGFTTLLRIILEQQVSLASADAMYKRVQDKLGEISPAGILGIGVEGLRGLGITRQKSAYLINVASTVDSDEFDLDELGRSNDGLVFDKLTSIKGIGPWTAGVYLLMALRRPDAWPPGDVALATSYRNLKGLKQRPGAAELNRVAGTWRPHRATAARLLWHFYLSEKQC